VDSVSPRLLRVSGVIRFVPFPELSTWTRKVKSRFIVVKVIKTGRIRSGLVVGRSYPRWNIVIDPHSRLFSRWSWRIWRAIGARAHENTDRALRLHIGRLPIRVAKCCI
jgi:hypothetical protein